VNRIILGTTAVLGIFVSATLISNLPMRGFANDGNLEDPQSQSEIQQGFAIPLSGSIWMAKTLPLSV
jgi:hypothetical protein